MLGQKQEHTNLSGSTSEWEMGLETSQEQIILKAMLLSFSASPNTAHYKHPSQIHEIPAADLVPTTQNLEKAVGDVCVICFLALKFPSLCRGAIAPPRKFSWLSQVGIFRADPAQHPTAGDESC